MDSIPDMECGCKGIRRCFICDKDEDRSFMSPDENKKTVQYSFCSRCNLCWPEDAPQDEIAVRLYLGKLAFISDFPNVEALTPSNQNAWAPSSSSERKNQDFGSKLKLKKRKGDVGSLKKLPRVLEDLIKSFLLHKEVQDSHPYDQCYLDYSPYKGFVTEPGIENDWIVTKSSRRTTDLLKEIRKFQDSISIVITTVDNQYVGHGNVEERGSTKVDQVIGAISDFIQEVKEDLGASARLSNITSKEQNFYENAMKFIDTFLATDGHSYTETGIFRRPDTFISGPEKNIQSDAPSYSENSNNQLRSHIIHDTARQIQKHYLKKMEVLEIQKLPSELRQGHDVLLKLMEEIGNSTTRELVRKIHYNVKDLGISLPIYYSQSIARGISRGNFEGTIDYNTELSSWSMEWTKPFEGVVKFLQESEQWYKFLNNLYAKFSEYEIQKEKDKYNVANIEDWGQSGKPQGLEVTANTFEQFLNKTAEYNITEHDGVKNNTVTELQLKELNHILNLTLKHTISMQCPEPDKLVIMGDFNIGINIDGALDNSCKNKNALKSINVFISNTLFVDKDLELFRGAIPITVIAPKWEIIGNRKITLDGLPGVPFPNKANDGALPGNNGEDGKPGLPGKTAGTFFGIGENFVNGENLKIAVNGGMGGPGQNGGNGKKGSDGRNPYVPSSEKCVYDMCRGGTQKINGFSCVKTDFYLPPVSVGHPGYRYRMFGIPGEIGGNGGNGGRGGKGGNPGDVILFELNNSSGISNQTDIGKEGGMGKAGSGGDGSTNGYNIIVHCFPPEYISFRFKTRWDWIDTEYNNKDNRGKTGTDGSNDKGIQDPEAAAVIHEPYTIINEYKSYLREDLNDRFRRRSLFQFLDHLESNNNVKNLYNTIGLVNDLMGFEKQFQNLNESGDVDLVPFYQSLLSRISEYAQNPKQGEESTQYKKVLNYLYTATLGRMYNLKDDSESNLVIDIYEYLNVVKKNVDVLKDLQKESNKADIINKYKESYKIGVDKKIEEAKNFIEKQIAPEIGNISTQIDKKIDSLINETIELQKQAEKEKEQLIKKKQELQNSLEMRGLFNCFKIMGTVTSFLGPVGAVTGTVIESVSTISESLVLDGQTSQQKISKLPASVLSSLKLLAEQIKTAKDEKITYLNKLLDDVSAEASKYPDKLSDTSAKIADIKKRLSKVNDKKFDFKEVTALEVELKQELKRKKGDLQNPDKKSEDALKVIGKFYQVAQLGADIYSKYKEDQSKLDALTKAIEEADIKFQNLKQYEEKIYNTIAPMLKNMEDGLQDIASKLDAKSQVALDVTKWQVQDTLKDMKLQMKEFTTGFKSEENLIRCIEKLEDAMTTLINVYDRIQTYQEQQNLANYIADVSSTAASNILITDAKLTNAVNSLEITIRSNLVLKQYKTTIDAFKQWVFPFAERYLEKSMLPSQLELDGNIQNLVSKAVSQIENLKSKLDEYKTSVKGQDRYIHTSEFSSNYVSTKPFFVWKNEEHKDMISKLLSGKEVVVNADIMNSAPEKEAIKFSFVELYFKSQNKTIQTEINNILKGFAMSLTHVGNSHYRYNDKMYVITSDSQNIQCSFEKNIYGEPVNKNNVYDKIKAGNLMLSPYTVWEMTIINSTDLISFQELDIYKDEIDVELAGYGSYVMRGANLSSFMVKDRLKGSGRTNPSVINMWSKAVDDANDNVELIHRYFSSDDQVGEMDRYMTSGSGPGLSSAINYACNLLKQNSMVVMSNIVTSVNQLIFTTKETVAIFGNSNADYVDTSSIFTKFTKDAARDVLIIPSDTNAEKVLKQSETDVVKSEDPTERPFRSEIMSESILTSEKETSTNNEIWKKPYFLSSINFNDYSKDSKSYIANEQRVNPNIPSFNQAAEVNSSLLLADYVSRSISGRKYKSEMDESLLSPQGWVKKRINDMVVQSEHDINENFYALSRPKNSFESSWFDKVKVYVKSTCKFLGFHKEENIDDYIQDIRNLVRQS